MNDLQYRLSNPARQWLNFLVRIKIAKDKKSFAIFILASNFTFYGR